MGRWSSASETRAFVPATGRGCGAGAGEGAGATGSSARGRGCGGGIEMTGRMVRGGSISSRHVAGRFSGNISKPRITAFANGVVDSRGCTWTSRFQPSGYGIRPVRHSYAVTASE